MNLLRQMVWEGLNRCGILLETFCLQGWVCGKWRLQVRWQWSGRRMTWRVHAIPERPHDPPAALQQPFPGLCSHVWDFILHPTPRKQGAECPGLCIFVAMLFLVVIPSSKGTGLHPLIALIFSCWVRITAQSLRNRKPASWKSRPSVRSLAGRVTHL